MRSLKLFNLGLMTLLQTLCGQDGSASWQKGVLHSITNIPFTLFGHSVNVHFHAKPDCLLLDACREKWDTHFLPSDYSITTAALARKVVNQHTPILPAQVSPELLDDVSLVTSEAQCVEGVPRYSGEAGK